MGSPIFVVAIFFLIGAACSPVDVSEQSSSTAPELPQIDGNASIAINPPTPLGTAVHGKKMSTVFLINIYALKNKTAQKPSDALHSDVIEEVTEETAEPLAKFVLVVEEGDDNATRPVNLDDVAKDLESEGFTTQKIIKNGETSIVKVDLSKVDRKLANNNDATIQVTYGQSPKVRRKRTFFKKKGFGGGGGGGGGGGCGGGCGGCGGGCYQQSQPRPVVYQAYVYTVQQPKQHCNVCG